MEKQEGGFMKGKYWSSPEFRNATEKQAQRTEIRTGENIPNNPEEKIENYLKRFTDIFDREDLKDREHGIQAIIKLLHKKYLIKPENISDEYIKGVVFGNYAEQKGYNTEQQRDPDTRRSLLEQFKKEFNKDFDSYNVPKDQREKVIESAIKDQTQRMDSWFSYLTGPEAKNYPVAYRYWAFAEMLKLGSYDDDRQTYNKRTEDTAASFPELDQQALAIVLDEINKKQKNNQSNLIIEDEQKQQEFKKRLQSENFGKLYAFVQEHLKTLRLPEERLLITKGEWKTFPKGSDAMRVVKILEGFHTKWCISGYGTAESYLSHSDLHIYLSEDEKGNYSIPRACIVNSEQNGITEVRGIMSDENSKQHLDSYITPIVSEKLKTIPTGEKWQEKMSDMKKLATIYIKFRQREGLNTDELRFVYELDKPIQSTGYGQDTRIAEILNGRDIIADMPILFECTPSQIATNPTEINDQTIAYIGPWNPEIYNIIKQYSNIKHLYESFPDSPIFLTTLETDPSINSPQKVEEALKNKSIHLTDRAKDILYKTEFSKSPQTYKLVQFTVSQLGFPNGATTDQIYAKAKDLGLELCPAEVGPHLRLSYEGKDWKLIAMKQISGRYGIPYVFRLVSDDAKLLLNAYSADPDIGWSGSHQFVFLSRK